MRVILAQNIALIVLKGDICSSVQQKGIKKAVSGKHLPFPPMQVRDPVNSRL